VRRRSCRRRLGGRLGVRGDVARAFSLALTAPDAPGRTLDIGSGESATVRSVVERIDAAVGGPAHPRFGARPDRGGEASVAPDLDAPWAVLGWQAEVGVEEGVRRTVAWYRRTQGGADRVSLGV
jgi:nucleoside-diphosphate-sugar epimerase